MQQTPHKLDLSRLAVLDRIADRTLGARRSAGERANELQLKRHAIGVAIEELRETARRFPNDQRVASQLAAKKDEFERLARPLEQAVLDREQINKIGNDAGLLAAHTRDWAVDAGLIEGDD